MPMYSIHPMNEVHASAVMSIFNHYIENDFSAYFEHPLPESFFSRLLEATDGYLAVVSCDEKGNVVGFACLRAYHGAPSFKRTAEVTYFIHPEHTRKGVGRLMLSALVDQAGAVGVDNIVASISSLNPDSIAFHSKNGFRECGRLSAVGRKFGRDFDVVYMQKKIR